VIPVIEEIVGPDVGVIDPAPAVARQVARILDSHGLRADATSESGRGTVICLTSGNPHRLRRLLPRLIGESCPVKKLKWDGDLLR
jgi:glutamate racemase